MWIVRDENGFLRAHEIKPIKANHWWTSPGWVVEFPYYSFPEVRWEDSEPTELILKR